VARRQRDPGALLTRRTLGALRADAVRLAREPPRAVAIVLAGSPARRARAGQGHAYLRRCARCAHACRRRWAVDGTASRRRILRIPGMRTAGVGTRRSRPSIWAARRPLANALALRRELAQLRSAVRCVAQADDAAAEGLGPTGQRRATCGEGGAARGRVRHGPRVRTRCDRRHAAATRGDEQRAGDADGDGEPPHVSKSSPQATALLSASPQRSSSVCDGEAPSCGHFPTGGSREPTGSADRLTFHCLNPSTAGAWSPLPWIPPFRRQSALAPAVQFLERLRGPR
jgi:hypothetical protein